MQALTKNLLPSAHLEEGKTQRSLGELVHGVDNTRKCVVSFTQNFE